MNESGNPCVFSPCRKWRYLLKHTWRDLLDPEERAIAWIALNPSTADENQLDPTLRRIRGYTRDMGCNTFYMLNLFAYRATDPKVMRAAEDPIGPENDYWIKKIAMESEMVVQVYLICTRVKILRRKSFDRLLRLQIRRG